jgi:hypothetical protein
MNKDNPPAFPRPASKFEINRLMSCPPQDGITMHDLCVIAALIGLCANPEFSDNNWRSTAEMAFHGADAMMDERNRRINEMKKPISKILEDEKKKEEKCQTGAKTT